MDPIRPNAGDLNDTSKADEIAASSVSKGNLTPEEQQAISDYRKTDLVWRANKHLRGQEGMLTKAKNAIFGPDQEMLKKIEHLDSAIKKSKTTQDMTVMRGFRLDQDPMKVFKPGSTFNEPAFASTTLARPVAEKFSTSFTQNQVLMEIDVPKGSNAHHMERREMEYDEAELLLARNAQFRVKSVNRRDDGKYVVNVGYEGSEPEKKEGGLHFDKGGLVPHHFAQWNALQQPPKVPGKFDKLKKAAGHVGSAYSKYGKPVQTAGSIFSTMASIPGVDPMAMALSAMSFLAPAGMAADQPFVKATPDAQQGSVDERTALMYAQLRKHQYEEAKTAGEAKPPIHKAEGGMIAPAPGVPVDADEVDVKATAGEFIMPVGPSNKFKPQLEQMRAGNEPHFDKGGTVAPPTAKRAPKITPDDYLEASWRSEEAESIHSSYAQQAKKERDAEQYRAHEEEAKRWRAIRQSMMQAEYDSRHINPEGQGMPELPSGFPKKPNAQSSAGNSTPVIEYAIAEGLKKVLTTAMPSVFGGGGSESAFPKMGIPVGNNWASGASRNQSSGSGASDTKDNDDLVSATRDLTEQIKELVHEMRQSNAQPGPQPDGSFIPMGPSGGHAAHTMIQRRTIQSVAEGGRPDAMTALTVAQGTGL